MGSRSRPFSTRKWACFTRVISGTISIVGVYGGMTDPLPMLQIFDKGLQIRMGQAHVKRWIGDLMPLVEDDDDPLGVEDLATHVMPLAEAPKAYETFQKKQVLGGRLLGVVIHAPRSLPSVPMYASSQA